MADTDIIVSEMTPASQINTGDLMIMTQPDAQAETGYTTKRGTVLQVANKMLKGTEYSTDLPDFTDKTPLGGLEELKADIKALLPIGSASGAIASFETNLTALLNSLKCEINASGGNGSPDSPIPIIGHSELNLTRCGKNFVSGKLENINIESNGEIKGGQSSNGFYGYVIADETYTITTVDTNIVYAFYEDFPEVGDFSYNNSRTVKTLDQNSFVAPISGWVLFRSNDLSFTNAQLELGSTATAYEPYNGQTFTVAFGQTVYGGVYDKSGRLTITWSVIDMGTLNYTYDNDGRFFANLNTKALGQLNLLCENYANSPSCSASQMPDNSVKGNDGNTYFYVRDTSAGTDAAAFKASLSGVMLAYELATPIVIDVSSISVFAEKGVNNIMSDCLGDVSVQYRDSIQHYIDSKIASVQALIL